MVKIYTNSNNGSIIIKAVHFILIATLIITLTGLVQVAAQQVREVDSYIAELGASDAAKGAKLRDLIYEVQPTVYINDGVFTPIGEGQMAVIQLDSDDLNKLQQGHPSLATVNLIMINVKDRTALQALRLQPSLLSGLPNLEYVFFSLGFDAAQTENFSGLQGFDVSQIVLLYESARPF